MGAGLPTQRVSGRLLVLQGGCEYLGGVGGNLLFELPEFGCRHRSKVGLHCYHLGADFLFELSSFSWGHRFKEKLYLLHLCFDGLRCDRAWTFFGVVSFLLASITCSSYVDSVLPWRGVSRSIRRRLDLRQRLAEPG